MIEITNCYSNLSWKCFRDKFIFLKFINFSQSRKEWHEYGWWRIAWRCFVLCKYFMSTSNQYYLLNCVCAKKETINLWIELKLNDYFDYHFDFFLSFKNLPSWNHLLDLMHITKNDFVWSICWMEMVLVQKPFNRTNDP